MSIGSLLPLLPLVPLPALAAFAALALAPVRLSRRQVLVAGVGGGVGAALLAAPLVAACALDRCLLGPVRVGIGGEVAGLEIPVTLVLTPVSAVATGVLTAVGAPVLLYAARAMAGLGTAVLRRFFALMNLFVAGMLTLVLAADAVVLFLGWELIGLCSFFLISFDGRERAVTAGRTAFVATRIADAALLAGLVLLCRKAGTVSLDGLMLAASAAGPAEMLAVALIVVGALGKSAQLPFQIWLPRAMAGPTPVSALLHSATMVAAGVVLLARLSPLLEAMPGVAYGLATIGLLGALAAGLAALMQRDLKALLAYSTISQLGYMMLAVGVGAPGAAMAHFATHAAFKALLFLSGGVLIEAAGHSRRLDDLRGAWLGCPLAVAAFAVGAAGLAGLPWLTAGWLSKEAILAGVLAGGQAEAPVLWAAALAGSVLTAAYALRPVALLVTGRGTVDPARAPAGLPIALPLGALAVATIGGGALVPGIAAMVGDGVAHAEGPVATLGLAAPVAGGILGVLFAIRGARPGRGRTARLFRAGFGADALVERWLAAPFRYGTAALSGDPAARAVSAIAVRIVGPVDAADDRPGQAVRLAARAGAVAERARCRAGSLHDLLTPDRIDRLAERAGRAFLGAAKAAAAAQRGGPRAQAALFAAGIIALLVLLTGVRWH